MFYHIKKKIILSNLKKKKAETPFNLEESELYELASNADKSINNSYFFTAHSNNGDSLVIRMGLRNIEDTEVFFFYKHNDTFLVHPVDLYKNSECPVKVKCLEVGKTWNVTFNGKLKEYDKDVMHDVVLDATFTATRPIFDFFYDSRSEGMAEAMAREKWKDGYFDEVSKNNQRHYEQTGHIDGEIIIDGIKDTISLNCVRDHSFGTRNWDYMDDHIWVCGILEDGSVINFSFVNYPCMKKIYLGYTDIESDKNVVMSGYQIVDYDINKGIGPDVSVIKCIFEDKREITLKCIREANLPILFDGGKYVFQEGIGEFEVDGKKARGTIEYGFNQNPKRWNY